MKGFSLLELLVTLVIIGIISSIAIPQYSEYKQRAFDTQAEADLRNVAIAEEVYFIDAEHYLSCQNEECEDLPGIKKLTNGVDLLIIANDFSFTGTATHNAGTGREYNWDSESGGFQ